MSRKFKTANYEETLNQTIRLAEALPPQHLARFVVDITSQLDLSKIYGRYAPVGGEAIAPEILLGLLFYGYATGVFSSAGDGEAMLGHLRGGFDPIEDLICPGHRHFLGHAARFEFHQQRMQATRRPALRASQIAVTFHQQLQHSGVVIEHHPAECLVA